MYGARDFLNSIKPEVIKITSTENKPIKLRFIVTPKFKKTDLSTGETEENLGYFSTKTERVYNQDEIDEIFNLMIEKVLEFIEAFQKEKLGWVYFSIFRFDIGISPFNPIGRSSFIPTPSFIANKNATIIVENRNDHECGKGHSFQLSIQ